MGASQLSGWQRVRRLAVLIAAVLAPRWNTRLALPGIDRYLSARIGVAARFEGSARVESDWVERCICIGPQRIGSTNGSANPGLPHAVDR